MNEPARFSARFSGKAMTSVVHSTVVTKITRCCRGGSSLAARGHNFLHAACDHSTLLSVCLSIYAASYPVTFIASLHTSSSGRLDTNVVDADHFCCNIVFFLDHAVKEDVYLDFLSHAFPSHLQHCR